MSDILSSQRHSRTKLLTAAALLAGAGVTAGMDFGLHMTTK